MNKYVVAYGNHRQELEKEVNALLESGYVLAGPLVAIEAWRGGRYLYQPMIFTEETDQ